MNLPPWLGRLLHGLGAGIVLALLRAPLGLDWTEIAVVQGTSAALFRAAGVLVVALALDARRTAFARGLGAEWLVGLLAGAGLQILVLERVPGSRAGFALLCLLAVFLLRALAGRRAAQPTPPPARRERVSLVLLGAGAALAFESLARELRLFTTGTVAEEGLLALVVLALVLAGALAFGPLLAKVREDAPGFALGLALSAGLCVAGLLFLAQLTPAGLFGYLRRFDVFLELGRRLDGALSLELGLASIPTLDGTSIGTLWTTTILAAAALVLPCFALGAAFGASRDATRPAHALYGAGLGLFVAPHLLRLLARPLQGGALPSTAWELVALGAALAGAALLVQALGLVRRGPWIALALVCAALPWVRPRLASANLSPWSARPVEPELLWPTPEGLLTVESGRNVLLVTLDRKRLTPTADEEPGDELALRSSFELLPAATRQRSVRALFIGQLTPARAAVLRSLGTLELERTAPWYAAMPLLEEHLFAGAEPPPGRILPPAAARARLSEGDYDWVFAAGIRGPVLSWKSEARELWGGVDAPRLTDLALPDGCLGVAWIPADARVARGVTLAPLLMSFDGLEHPSFGLVRGDVAEATVPTFELPRWQGPSVLSYLAQMPQLRGFENERAFVASLAPGARPELVRGLARHYAAQTLSSPYETRAQQIELDEEALRDFKAAVPAPGELDRFSAALWEALAWLFQEKRQPEFALVYLEPVAQRFGPWPLLDRTLAFAYREVLEPETALVFAERVLAGQPNDIELLVLAGQAAKEAGDGPRGVAYLERALALQPRREDLVRELGLALLAAGDGRGRPLLEALLRQHPEDEVLLRALSAGPEAR